MHPLEGQRPHAGRDGLHVARRIPLGAPELEAPDAERRLQVLPVATAGQARAAHLTLEGPARPALAEVELEARDLAVSAPRQAVRPRHLQVRRYLRVLFLQRYGAHRELRPARLRGYVQPAQV